jgi:hypothetical protein
MNGFADTYKISHFRMLQAIEGLSADQLRWRPHPAALSIFEMFMHVAGGEVFFESRLAGRELSAEEKRIESCARDRVINESPFPFSDAEASPEILKSTLEHSHALVKPLMEDPGAWEDKQIETPLGPSDYAAGIFARIAQHPAYHTGQAWIYRNDPRFPTK